MTTTTGTHTTVEAVCAALRAEAADLLATADRNRAQGRPDNARWCYAAAFGYLRAIPVVRGCG